MKKQRLYPPARLESNEEKENSHHVRKPALYGIPMECVTAGYTMRQGKA